MSGYAKADAALRELADGQLGEGFAETLYRVTAAVGRGGPFPPPSGGHRWDTDDILEAANSFLADEHTQRRLATILVQSIDGKTFQAQLAAAVKNYLRDQGRKTDRGHLIARLRDVLDNDDRFEQGRSPRTWRRSGTAQDDYTGSLNDLIEAAYSVRDVPEIRWASRRGPIAAREDLARLLETVLERAGAAIDERTLSEVLERRLGLSVDALAVALDDLPPAEHPTDPAFEAHVADADLAARIWAQLTHRERLIVAHAHLDVRRLGEQLGIGRSAAHEARTRLAGILEPILAGQADGESVWEVLQERAQSWIQERTERSGSAFVTHTSGESTGQTADGGVEDE